LFEKTLSARFMIIRKCDIEGSRRSLYLLRKR
jgi:hypothetical protein